MSSLGLVARRQIVLETPNKDQSLQETLICELMLDWYPRTVPSASYKTRGKVWPIVGILRYHIRSIRRRGYYLFYRRSLCGIYLRVAFIDTSSCQTEAILREIVD